MCNCGHLIRKMGRSAMALAVLASPLLATATPYDVGHVWKRAAEWTEGAQVGASLGNPAPDSLGRATWSYALTTAAEAGLDTAAPWFTTRREAMVWGVFEHPGEDPRARWERAGGEEPSIGRYGITHSRSARFGGAPYQPLVAWRNPTGESLELKLAGRGTFTWGGSGNLSVPYGIEFVIAHRSAASDTYTVLFDTEVARPGRVGEDGNWERSFKLPALKLWIEPGDQIVFSTRAIDTEAAPADAFASLRDSFVMRIQRFADEAGAAPLPPAPTPAVPEAPTLAMLLGGLLALAAVRSHAASQATPNSRIAQDHTAR
jgi:hypothetical protein